jgi:outer membrane receptor protein involved in Fe transport
LSQNTTVRGLTALLAGSPLNGVVPEDSFGRANNNETLQELSFFGEVAYKFNQELSATVGLRRYSIKARSATGFSGLIAGGGVVDPIQRNSNESGLTYKAVLNYRPHDDLLFFAG